MCKNSRISRKNNAIIYREKLIAQILKMESICFVKLQKTGLSVQSLFTSKAFKKMPENKRNYFLNNWTKIVTYPKEHLQDDSYCRSWGNK